MNKIILTGRLTKDVDLRHDPSNKPVASTVLAVDRPFLNASGQRDADFIPIVIWGKAAEFLKEKCRKTSRILVDGRLQIRNFDAKDGTKHWVAEVVVEKLELLDRKEDNPVPTETAETKVVAKNATTKTAKKENKPISSFMLADSACDDDIPW